MIQGRKEAGGSIRLNSVYRGRRIDIILYLALHTSNFDASGPDRFGCPHGNPAYLSKDATGSPALYGSLHCPPPLL